MSRLRRGSIAESQAFSYLDTVLLDSPVGFWPMQESSGNLTDVSGNNRTAVAVGTGLTYQVSGPSAGVSGIEFAGNSSSGFYLADDNDWSASEFTVEAFLYIAPSFFDGQPLRYWMTKHNSGVTNEWFACIQDQPGRSLFAQVNNTGDTNFQNEYVGPTWGNEEQWYNVAFTFDGSVVQLYVNGTHVGTPASASGERAANGAGYMTIGYGPAVATRSWKGRMSNVSFYNTALSSARILAHAQAGGLA